MKMGPDLHYVNSEKHYMTDDIETVIEICKEGIAVDKFGIPKERERKKFKGRLFYDDRHYLNIILLAAISLGYLFIDTDELSKKILKTGLKHNELLNMTVKEKIILIVDGIIDSCINIVRQNIPQFEGVFTKQVALNLLKNPLSLDELIGAVNERAGVNNSFLSKSLRKDMDINLEQIVDMFLNDPASPLIVSFFTYLDIHFFTPMSYYLHLIKPFYSSIYNIVIEIKNIYMELQESSEQARTMLFSMPMEFDLTALGESIILNGKKSRRVQKINKFFKDEDFIKSFRLRGEFLVDELKEVLKIKDEEHNNAQEERISTDVNVIELSDFKSRKKR